jgi:Ankyrin repeats (3 copies)
MKGCAWLIGLFFVLAAGAYVFLLDTPVRGSVGLPLVTATLVTVTLATLWSVVLTAQQWRAIRPPNTWSDGSLVGYSGKISGPAPLTAPASGRLAAIYEYSVTVRRHESRVGETSGRRVSPKNRTTGQAFQGAGMTACTVSGRGGSFRLIGFPLLAELSPSYLESRDEVGRLARHLLESDVKPHVRGLKAAVAELETLLNDEDGVVRIDTAGTAGVDLEAFRGERIDEAADALAEALHDVFAVVEERVVPQGAEVTVFGRYRNVDRTIDVGGATRHLTHAVKLGAGGRVGRRALVQAVVLCGIASLITGLVSTEILVPVVRSRTSAPYAGRPLTFESIVAARLRAEEGARLLVDSISERDSQKVALLLDLKVDPNGAANGTTPIEASRDAATIRLLLAVGADPDGTNPYGQTRLQQAAQLADVEVATTLLDAGADPNRADASGATPLDDARANGHDELAALLLRRGAVETEVTAETGSPVDSTHPAVATVSEYLAALQARDLVRIRTFDPRSIDWGRIEWEPFLENRPASVTACTGYANEERATVRVSGPTASGAASLTLFVQLERGSGGTPERDEGWHIAREWLQWP